MKRFAHIILVFCALAVIIVPFHLLKFGQPDLDRRMLWILSNKPLYHVENIGGHRLAVPNQYALATDSVNPRTFSIVKAPRVFRVFCVGQSTTEGYPFAPRGGYPQWLGQLLKDVIPGRKIEVINAGVSGSDSARDLATVREVLHYHPDLLILFEDGNERRQGRLRILQEHFGINFGLFAFWLQGEFPIIRWAGAQWHAPEPSEQELFPAFQRDVDSMIAVARARGVPIILLGRLNWEMMKNPSAAYPYNHFLLTRRSSGVLCIDTLSVFLSSGRCLDIGPSCLLDTVHQSLLGQWILAVAVAHALAASGWIAPKSAWHWQNLKTMAVYRKRLELTNHFLAKALVLEAWSPRTDLYGASLIPYDIAQSDHFEKDAIPEIVRANYRWLGPPDPPLKKAIMSYFEKTNPSEAEKFQNVLREANLGM